MKKLLLPFAICALVLSTQSCKKDEDTKKDYTVPTTYNFDNVDYSGQTNRLKMITELVTVVRTGSTGAQLNAQQLKNMYSNSGNPFTNDTLNTSGKQLKDKTFAAAQATIETWIDQAAVASQSGATAQEGTAGISTSGTKAYLVNATGIEYKEAIEKYLQGALIYYQITAVYLSEDKIGPQVALADRQHHWDEAFGYFGVPTDYPTNTTGLQHVGKYANDRNAILGNSTKVMDAFLKGRAAINNDDDATVAEQAAIVRENVELGVAATGLHYINGALANITDQAVFLHNYSEAYFIIRSLMYNPSKKISDTQLDILKGYIGDNAYDVTTQDLQNAKNLLSTIYGFDSVKDQL